MIRLDQAPANACLNASGLPIPVNGSLEDCFDQLKNAQGDIAVGVYPGTKIFAKLSMENRDPLNGPPAQVPSPAATFSYRFRLARSRLGPSQRPEEALCILRRSKKVSRFN